MIERLFIYGSLGPGRPNEPVMTAIGGEWVVASVRGRLINAGWGAQLGFPGMVPDPDAESVNGWLFVSENLAAHWQALDEFEGEGYQRVRITAQDEQGQPLEAFVYALIQSASS